MTPPPSPSQRPDPFCRVWPFFCPFGAKWTGKFTEFRYKIHEQAFFLLKIHKTRPFDYTDLRM